MSASVRFDQHGADTSEIQREALTRLSGALPDGLDPRGFQPLLQSSAGQ